MARRPTNKKIIEALNNNGAVLVNAAQELGCSRQWLKIWIDKTPELSEAYYQAKESLKDLVEHQLLKNIKDGKETSLIWYMKTQMRDRGYIDKIENDTTMTIDAVKIKYVLPDQPQEEQIPLPLNNEVIKIELPKQDE